MHVFEVIYISVVSGVQNLDQFLVPETWAENLGRVPSTLMLKRFQAKNSVYRAAVYRQIAIDWRCHIHDNFHFIFYRYML